MDHLLLNCKVVRSLWTIVFVLCGIMGDAGFNSRDVAGVIGGEGVEKARRFGAS